jgi:hypothetical protein
MGGEELRRYQLYLLHERKFAPQSGKQSPSAVLIFGTFHAIEAHEHGCS